ncbi:MAG TPA: Yip1 family protein [Caulobacteraceae bacterium]
MSVVEGGPTATNMIQRIQNILLKPKDEWVVIDGEAATPQSLMVGYACILAAIPAVAGFLGQFLFTHSLVGGLIFAVLGYVLSLAAVFVESIIINALASSFDATANPTQALKAAVYANTAAWVAGVAGVIPILGGLVALAGFAYSCYLLYLGLGVVMKAPADKSVGYTAVSIIAYIVLFGVAFWITAAVVAMVVASAAITAGAMLH